jgi:hypothetical protein
MAFSNPVVGGEGGELIRESIKSPDFLTLVQGWIIRRDGSAEFNNILIRGGVVVGGSITIGPAGMPQVVIDSNATEGFIEFPTNDALEVNVGRIAGAIVNDGLAFESLAMELTSPSIAAADVATLRLESANADASDTARIDMFVPGGNRVTLNDTRLTSNTEIFVQGVGLDNNYVMRLTDGRTNGVAATTNIGAVDTVINNNSCQSCPLENGVAYRVDIQIEMRCMGVPVAGANQVNWKLWDGAVGGTQLGSTVTKTVDSANALFSSQTFTFVFEHTGSTGQRTVNLSGVQTAGPNIPVARTSDQYFMMITRIGDPNRVQNL